MTKRPASVTVISVLYFASTGSYTALAVLDLFSRDTLVSLLNQLSPQGVGPAPILLRMEPLLWLYLLMMAAGGALVGYGMWTLRNWARIVTIVITVASLVSEGEMVALGLLVGDISAFTLLFTLFRLALCVLLLSYLWRPGVRAAFRRKAPMKEANSFIGGGELYERG
jgi:hypothetical protein